MIQFIVAPYHLGEKAIDVGAGPLSILSTGVAGRLHASVSEVNAGPSSDWQSVNSRIALEVRRAVAGGSLPLVLAGNCNSCLGTLAALANPDLGIVWFDAHGDFHTPETSLSGSLEGMSLTRATQSFVQEDRVVLVGCRDLEPGERERVSERLKCIPDGDFSRAGKLPHAAGIYVHIDMDVLDPSISPGVNFQGAGGLTVETLVDALVLTFSRYTVKAIALVNYNPSRDCEGRTRDIAVLLIEEIARLREDAASR